VSLASFLNHFLIDAKDGLWFVITCVNCCPVREHQVFKVSPLQAHSKLRSQRMCVAGSFVLKAKRHLTGSAVPSLSCRTRDDKHRQEDDKITVLTLKKDVAWTNISTTPA
jgi:hypothetical protein